MRLAGQSVSLTLLQPRRAGGDAEPQLELSLKAEERSQPSPRRAPRDAFTHMGLCENEDRGFPVAPLRATSETGAEGVLAFRALNFCYGWHIPALPGPGRSGLGQDAASSISCWESFG